MKMKNINSILIITLSNIGDVILTTPVIDVLKKQLSSAQIDIICGLRAIDLFKADPAFRHVFAYNKFSSLRDKVKFILQLRRQKYDLVVDLKNTLIPWFLNAPYRSSFLKAKPNKEILHMKDKHLKKLDKLGVDTAAAQFHIYVSEEDQALVEKRFKDVGKGKLVAISPGARSEIKRWAKEGFITVSKKLLDDFKYQVVLIGDKDDLKVGQEISAFLSNRPVNLIAQTTLPQLAHLLKKCSLLVTNDSACLHMASAVGTKTLAIFGPTHPDKYGPLAAGSVVIRKKLSCSPCEVAQCRFKRECMRQIKPEEVLNKIKEMV